MHSPFGARPRSALKRKNMMRSTPQAMSGFQGRRQISPNKPSPYGEERKRPAGIGADFEERATKFFGNKGRDDTDSLYNKKTYHSTDMDLTNFDTFDYGERDPIYDNTVVGHKGITRIIIENPLLNNVHFQMLLFYNFFYSLLHFFLLFTILIYKLWIFRTREYKEYIAFVLIILYLPLEFASLYFGYRGNINETVRLQSLIYNIVP